MRRLHGLFPFTLTAAVAVAALSAVSCNTKRQATNVEDRRQERPSFLLAQQPPSGGLRCVLYADSIAARMDSCTHVTAPPPPVAPPPPPPPPPPVAPPPPPPIIGAGCPSTHVRLVSVSNATQLHTALTTAHAGDVIQMADGTYSGSSGEFRITNISGTALQPIALCGSVNAIIDASSLSSKTGVFISGSSYWILAGFSITNGLFGVYASKSPHLTIDGLTVHSIGQEAIEVNDFSNYLVVQGSRIYDTGRVVAEYGEGVYIGSANSNWPSITGGAPDTTNYAIVRYNTFGPNVRAEHVDVKEATHGTLIRHNSFDGTGMVESQGSGVSGWPNSNVILQGMNATVDSNTATHPLIAAFRVVTHGTIQTGSGNTFSANTADVGGRSYGFLIQAGSLTSTNVVKCDNHVTNATSGVSNIACTP